MKTKNLKIDYVNIETLKPSEYNPRKFDKKQYEDLKKSIEKFGFVDPLVVNCAQNRKNVVIGGHFRLKIAKDLGYKQVPVVYVNIPDVEKEKELNLRLNKNLGDWDLELLAQFDENLLKEVGFDSEELDEIFGLEVEEEFDIEKEIEKVLEKGKPRCKEGDLWQLGEHRLYIGDATKRESLEKLLKGESVNMILTDPPYGLGGYAGRSGKFLPITGDDENILRFYKAIPIAKEMYIWGDWRFFTQIVNIFGMPHSVIIWKKPTFGMGKGYRRQYELLFYWGNYKGTKYSDVWEFEREKQYQHPSTKPVELCKRCIENSSKRGDIVLDMFGGSGSTLIACEIMKRKCRMIEIEPIYGEVIINRWEKFTGKKAEKL